MDLKLQSETLIKDLSNIDLSSHDLIRQTSKAVSLCRDVLSLFKREVINKEFPTVDLEIEFFKHIKQIPLQHLIYYSQIRSFELQFPRAILSTQQDYITSKMSKLNRFFTYNLDFAHYIESGQEHLDRQYFTRSHFNTFPITHSKFYYLEPEFNTSHDMLLGKLLAYKSLIGYLQQRLVTLEQGDSHNSTRNGNSHSSLQWTSSKTGMTELVYALYHAGVVNNGKADIKEIAQALQRTFNFDLGDYYRTYTEIRARKKSRVKFLDELSTRLISRLDQEDE